MECDEEIWSWSYFKHDQIDAYWIRCTLVIPHDEHEDENTGARWERPIIESKENPSYAHYT